MTPLREKFCCGITAVVFVLIFAAFTGGMIYNLIDVKNAYDSNLNFNRHLVVSSCNIENCAKEVTFCGNNVCCLYNLVLVPVELPDMSKSVKVGSDCEVGVCYDNGTMIMNNVTTCYYNSLDVNGTLSLQPIAELDGSNGRVVISGIGLAVVLAFDLYMLCLVGMGIWDILKKRTESRPRADGSVRLV